MESRREIMPKNTYHAYSMGKCPCGCFGHSLCTMCGERTNFGLDKLDDDGDHLSCVHALKEGVSDS